MVKRKLSVWLWLTLLLASAWAPRALAEVEVSIDRNPVQVSESFQLVFSLDQSPDTEPDFSSLQQHFLILNNSRSSSISIITDKLRRDRNSIIFGFINISCII